MQRRYQCFLNLSFLSVNVKMTYSHSSNVSVLNFEQRIRKGTQDFVFRCEFKFQTGEQRNYATAWKKGDGNSGCLVVGQGLSFCSSRDLTASEFMTQPLEYSRHIYHVSLRAAFTYLNSLKNLFLASI
jgi:hypothetical protein